MCDALSRVLRLYRLNSSHSKSTRAQRLLFLRSPLGFFADDVASQIIREASLKIFKLL